MVWYGCNVMSYTMLLGRSSDEIFASWRRLSVCDDGWGRGFRKLAEAVSM